MKLGIVVPVLKNYEGFANFIYSVQRNCIPYDLYVFPNWIENKGVSVAWNAGIRQLILNGCTHILVSNDDVILGPHSIRSLIGSCDRYGLVSATNIKDERYDNNRIWHLKPIEVERPLNQSPDFACFMITPETFKKVGRFDENFSPAYFEDNDYHYRIRLAGLEAGSDLNAPMLHLGSVTQNMDGPVVPAHVFEKNKSYYLYKWGGMPWLETYNYPYNDSTLSYADWEPERFTDEYTGVSFP